MQARSLRLPVFVRAVLWGFGWLIAGAAISTLAYQVPARHIVHVGQNDQGYVQGFEDATNRWGVVTDDTGVAGPYRWSRPESALIFPQIGLPARATIRWRAWRPPGVPLPRVRVLLNGGQELGSFGATGNWEEHSFPIRAGLWKPRDLFLQLQVEPTLDHDGNTRGVQVDHAVLETSGWPITPYPGQVAGGSLATVLAAIFLHRRPRLLLAMVGGMALLFLLGYRLHVTPYPLRLLWPALICILLSVLVADNLHRLGRAGVLHGAAGATLAIWAAVMWWVGQAHVVLSAPGVEKDFRVFATRSNALRCPPGARLADAECVLRADGFYQLGYPFVLWLVRPAVAGNPFLAARLVALLSGAVLLVAVYLLGRVLLGPAAGLLALLFVVLNRWTTEYTLYLGTDMPFAAAAAFALLALVTVRRSRRHAFVAGLLCGLLFLIRHPGLVLLPLGCALLLRRARPYREQYAPTSWRWRSLGFWRVFVYAPDDAHHAHLSWRRRYLLAGSYLLGFLIASLPQLLVNVIDTGRPLYSQQAKNIWLAVYGNTDWTRWNEASNDVSLADLISHEPGRFLGNWWGNLKAFWGTGSEDTSEFGRALALRLLTFPANLLAMGGLLLWIARGDRRERFLLLAGVLYISAIAIGFLLPRFVLPLVPIWALMAAAAARCLLSVGSPALRRVPARRLAVAGGALLLLLLLGAPRAGIHSVLNQQDPEAVAAATLIMQTLSGNDRLVAHLPPEDSLAKYSAVAHLVARDGGSAARYTLQAGGESGSPPGLLLVGRAGRYALYRSAQ